MFWSKTHHRNGNNNIKRHYPSFDDWHEQSFWQWTQRCYCNTISEVVDQDELHISKHGFVLFVCCLFEWHSIIYKHPATRGLYITIGHFARKSSMWHIFQSSSHKVKLLQTRALGQKLQQEQFFLRSIAITSWHNHIIIYNRLAQD